MKNKRIKVLLGGKLDYIDCVVLDKVQVLKEAYDKRYMTHITNYVVFDETTFEVHIIAPFQIKKIMQ
jgi:hypothetical protein